MPQSELEQLIEQYQRDLLRNERQAASGMVRAYGRAWRAIQREIASLTRRYYRAVEAGTATNEMWLYQMNRLQSLRRQVEAQMQRYARYAEQSIRLSQWEAVQAANRNAPELIAAVMGQGPVNLQFGRLPAQALENLIAALQSGSPVSQRLRWLVGNSIEIVENGLLEGLTLGQGARAIERAIREAFGGNLAKSLMWARTETLRAYRTASLQTYRANQDVVKGWTWRSARNERTCAMCWAMDGTFHTLDETLDDHPSGRCFAIPQTKTWAELGYPGVPEIPGLQPVTGVEAFGLLNPAQQAKILGPAKYRAWQDGTITLPDLVGSRYNPSWGPMRYEKSLRELGIKV